MSTYPTPAAPEDLAPFLFSRPVCSLPVSSIPSAIDYWTTKLPFYLRGRDGDNHCWVQTLGSDAVNVYLRRRGFVGPRESDNDDDARCGKVYIRVALYPSSSSAPDDKDAAAEQAIKGLYIALVQRGAQDVRPVAKMPWGHWTCGFVDLDRNEVHFYAEGVIPQRRSEAVQA